MVLSGKLGYFVWFVEVGFGCNYLHKVNNVFIVKSMATSTKNTSIKSFRPSELFKLKEESHYIYKDRDIDVRSYEPSMVAEMVMDDGSVEIFVNDRKTQNWTKTSTDMTALPDAIAFEAYGQDRGIFVRWDGVAQNEGYRIYIDDWYVDVAKDLEEYNVVSADNTQTPNFEFVNGQQYEVTLAVLVDGRFKKLAGAFLRPVEVLVGSVPSQLESISVNIKPNGLVEIRFSTPSNVQPPITHFELEDKTNGGIVISTVNQFDTLGWKTGERRQYSIYAVNEIGNGIPTTLNILYDMAVPAPTNVTVAQATTNVAASGTTPASSVTKRGYLDVAWTHPTTTNLILNYEVAYKLKNLTTWTSVSVPTGQNRTQIGLLNVGEYNVRVRAQGQTNHSAWVDATPLDTPVGSTADPVDPATIRATVVGSNIKLDWDAALNAIKYNVYVDGVLAGTTASLTFDVAQQTGKTIYKFEVESVGDNGAAPKSELIFEFKKQELKITDVAFFIDKKVVKARVSYENSVQHALAPTATSVKMKSFLNGTPVETTLTFDTTKAKSDLETDGGRALGFDNYDTQLSFEVQQSHGGAITTTTYDFEVNKARILPPVVSVKTDYLFDVLKGGNEWETKIFSMANTKFKTDKKNDGQTISDTTQNVDLPADGVEIDMDTLEADARIFSRNSEQDSYIVNVPPAAAWNLPLSFFGSGGITATNVVVGTTVYGDFQILPVVFGFPRPLATGFGGFDIDIPNKKITVTHGYVPYVRFKGQHLGFMAEQALPHLVLIAGNKRIIPDIVGQSGTTSSTEYVLNNDLTGVNDAYFKDNFYFENYLFGFESSDVMQSKWVLVAGVAPPSDMVSFTNGKEFTKTVEYLGNKQYAQFGRTYKVGNDIIVENFFSDDDPDNATLATNNTVRRAFKLSNGKFTKYADRKWGSVSNQSQFGDLYGRNFRNFVNNNKYYFSWEGTSGRARELWSLPAESAEASQSTKVFTFDADLAAVEATSLANNYFKAVYWTKPAVVGYQQYKMAGSANGTSWGINPAQTLPFGKDIVSRVSPDGTKVFVVRANINGATHTPLAELLNADGTVIWSKAIKAPGTQTNVNLFEAPVGSSRRHLETTFSFVVSCYIATNGDLYFNTTNGHLYKSTDNGTSWTRTTIDNDEVVYSQIVELSTGEVGFLVVAAQANQTTNQPETYYRFHSMTSATLAAAGARVHRYNTNPAYPKHVIGTETCAVVDDVIVFVDRTSHNLKFFNLKDNRVSTGYGFGNLNYNAAVIAVHKLTSGGSVASGDFGDYLVVTEYSATAFRVRGTWYGGGAANGTLHVTAYNGGQLVGLNFNEKHFLGSSAHVITETTSGNPIKKVAFDTGLTVTLETNGANDAYIDYQYNALNPYATAGVQQRQPQPPVGTGSNYKVYLRPLLLTDKRTNVRYYVEFNDFYALIFNVAGTNFQFHKKVYFVDGINYTVTDAAFDEDTSNLVFVGVSKDANDRRGQIQTISLDAGKHYVAKDGNEANFPVTSSMGRHTYALTSSDGINAYLFYGNAMYQVSLAGFAADTVKSTDISLPTTLRSAFTYKGQKFLIGTGSSGIYTTTNFKSFAPIKTGSYFSSATFTNDAEVSVYGIGDAPMFTAKNSINRLRDFQNVTAVTNSLPVASGEIAERLATPIALSNSEIAGWFVTNSNNTAFYLCYISDNSTTINSTKVDANSTSNFIPGQLQSGVFHNKKLYLLIRRDNGPNNAKRLSIEVYNPVFENGVLQEMGFEKEIPVAGFDSDGQGVYPNIWYDRGELLASENGFFLEILKTTTQQSASGGLGDFVDEYEVHYSKDLNIWDKIADYPTNLIGQQHSLLLDTTGMYAVGNEAYFLPYIKPNTP